METPPGNGGSDRRRRWIKIGVIVSCCAIVLALIAWWAAPALTGHMLAGELEDLEERTGLDISAASAQTTGFRGVELRDFELSLPDDDRPLLSIDHLDASVDLLSALRSRPAISELDIEGLRISLHRHADDSDDLGRLREHISADDDPDAPDETKGYELTFDERLELLAQRALRHFGGEYPRVSLRDMTLELTHDDRAAPWPISAIETDEFTMEGGAQQAAFETQLLLTAPDSPHLVIPERISISGTMRRPVKTSTVAVDVDPEIRIANLDVFPFAELSATGFQIGRDYTVELTGPAIDSRLGGGPHQLASADRIYLQFDRWPRAFSDINIDAIEIDGPRAYVEFDHNGGSNLSDLYTVARQPSARQVTATARALGNSFAMAPDASDGADASDASDGPDASDDRSGSIREQIASLSIRDLLIDYIPRSTRIRDLGIVVEDRRTHDDLTRPTEYFEITGDVIELQHSPLQGLLEGDVQLTTRTEDDTGEANIQFHIPYRTGNWNASVRVDQLQLAHFAQLGGSRVSDYLHGGEISANLSIENDGGDQATTRFDGLVAGDDIRLYLDSIADDPIEVASSSLYFDGYYDPSMAIPDAQLIDAPPRHQTDAEEAPHSDEHEDPKEAIPDRGGFVVEQATARLGDVEATLATAVYGIDGLRRPTRLDFDIALESTPLQDIIDAIPAAVRGPLDGIQMVGDLSWDFQIEVPVYEASRMVWDAHVDLSPDLEVVEIPAEVDVFGMTEEFEHTIEDQWDEVIEYREREMSYQRTVTIPEMSPTPADWLIENTSLELDQIDEIRRQREWPEVPDFDPDRGIDRATWQGPDYWLTSTALEEAADRPWSDDDQQDTDGFWNGWNIDDDDPKDSDELIYEQPDPPAYHELEIEVDADRHGPYVYVPLHHISPYVVRAIMTTEDNSFFTHSGFNFLAIRQSVEQNLEAGRYVRGASTISMQLAKNLFLDRDRLLARKLQEVALVWLMESVAEVPKARMMELYFNIIEFGPGIYGINQAAMHYFGKRPDELDIAEAAWLVSIVPNPKEYHRYYDRGEITDYWFRRMTRYIRAMEARDRITEREMEQAIEEPPEFYLPEDGEPLLRPDADEIDPDDAIDPDDSDRTPNPLQLPRFN